MKAKNYSDIKLTTYSIESNQIYFLPNSKRYDRVPAPIDPQISAPAVPCCVGGKCSQPVEQQQSNL